MSEFDMMAAGSVGMTPEQEAALSKDDGLGFISVQHGVSQAVMHNNPKGVRAGDFLIGGTTIIEGASWGEGFRCVVGPTRPRAVVFKNNAIEMDSWDPNSKQWAEIAARVAARGDISKGAKVGYEFMLWLPDHDFMGVLMIANRDRQTVGKKLIELRNQKKLARVSTTIKGAKNSVYLTVEEEKDPEPITFPTPERYAACLAAFEAYKQEKQAPQGPRR